MPKKIKQWWVYTADEHLRRELARLLIEEKDYHEEHASPDGPLPMWCISEQEVFDKFMAVARAGDSGKYTVYEEGQFDQMWRMDRAKAKGSNLKLVEHNPPPVRRLKHRKHAG